MALVDLKRPKPAKKETTEKVAAVASSWDERPYCMRFTFQKPELDKLGLKPEDFVGMEPITATVVLDPINIRSIESKSEDDYDKNNNKAVEVQVIKIDLGKLVPRKPGIDEKIKKANAIKNAGPGE